MECCLCSKEIVGVPVIADLFNFWIFCGDCYLVMGKGRMVTTYNHGRDYMIIDYRERGCSINIILEKYMGAVQLELFSLNCKEEQRAPYQFELFPLFKFKGGGAA